jgi:hypothetical protein
LIQRYSLQWTRLEECERSHVCVSSRYIGHLVFGKGWINDGLRSTHGSVAISDASNRRILESLPS